MIENRIFNFWVVFLVITSVCITLIFYSPLNISYIDLVSYSYRNLIYLILKIWFYSDVMWANTFWFSFSRNLKWCTDESHGRFKICICTRSVLVNSLYLTCSPRKVIFFVNFQQRRILFFDFSSFISLFFIHWLMEHIPIKTNFILLVYFM